MSPKTSPTFRVLAHDIKNLGVDCVFGLMSDDTAMFATELDLLPPMAYMPPSALHARAPRY